MRTKRLAIAALAVINAVLLLLLLSPAALLPEARAQARGGGGGYVVATATASGRTVDVVYMIDLGTKKLYSLYPGRDKLQFTAVPRDLDKDFGK